MLHVMPGRSLPPWSGKRSVGRLQVAYLEGGACFVCKFVVAVHGGCGILLLEVSDERAEGFFLRGGTCVLWGLAVRGDTTDVRNAD